MKENFFTDNVVKNAITMKVQNRVERKTLAS